MDDEEEIDRLIFSSLCNDIMDEVLDLGSEQIVLARTNHGGRSASAKTKNKRKNKNKHSSL